MRKILYFGLALPLLFASCKDYLDVASESQFEQDFVFQTTLEADKAILGVYELMRNTGGFHSNRLFYDFIVASSDTELGPENPIVFGNRYNNSSCYFNTPKLADVPHQAWDGMYNMIQRANLVIDGFEQSALFADVDRTKPSNVGHLYAEAFALRATAFFELVRAWGDVPYYTTPIRTEEDYKTLAPTDRDLILEGEIAALELIEPMLYRITDGGATKTPERIHQEYVQGLIARMAMTRAGYQLRPADYQVTDGEVLGTAHSEWGKHVRRGDWKSKWVPLADKYLEKMIKTGSAALVTADPRTPATKYGNPFQYVFQQMMNWDFSTESIFEISEAAGVQGERPYAFGRSVANSSGTGFPPKSYGQVRFYPTYYYGRFDPTDKRRDVTVTATVPGLNVSEVMLNFDKGNMGNGGLVLNKWDDCRLKTPATSQRKSGINAPYMRMGDMVLLYAETRNILGDDPGARAQLLKIRQRAFDTTNPRYDELVTNYVNSKSGEALLTAIQDERALELGGEGQRKYDLVRWGLYGKKINELQKEMTAMVAAIESQGYYTFANGNTISAYVYYKSVAKAESGVDNLLTTTCDVTPDDPRYEFLYPAWRGVYEYTTTDASVKLEYKTLAIRGLFEYIADTPAGYSAHSWGQKLVDNKNLWTAPVTETVRTNIGVFGGYIESDYQAGYQPRCLLPYPATALRYSSGNLVNKYGFPQD